MNLLTIFQSYEIQLCNNTINNRLTPESNDMIKFLFTKIRLIA